MNKNKQTLFQTLHEITLDFYQTFLRQCAFFLDAERAHKLSILALQARVIPPQKKINDPRLHVHLAALDFPNPVGFAAGFDKNAQVATAIAKLGFGFVEVGTLTPRAQTGNSKPRIFRLRADGAIINRLGFNNQGHGPALHRLEGKKKEGIVGINLGANRDSSDFIDDYERGLAVFWDHASYFTINISSPNTPGLRHLQMKNKTA